jgi:hypothetical protein
MLKYFLKKLSVGKMSKDAIYMMKPKNTAALGGKFIENKGISTMICCVLIIDQSCCNDADRIMFSAMLPAITTLVVVDSDAVAAASCAARPPLEYYLGRFLSRTVLGAMVLPN